MAFEIEHSVNFLPATKGKPRTTLHIDYHMSGRLANEQEPVDVAIYLRDKRLNLATHDLSSNSGHFEIELSRLRSASKLSLIATNGVQTSSADLEVPNLKAHAAQQKER